jgi:sulfur transfer complex TusBCD TusB component (DsrH family)
MSLVTTSLKASRTDDQILLIQNNVFFAHGRSASVRRKPNSIMLLADTTLV